MNTYELRFKGRKVGAIVVFHKITAQVFADNEDAATLALYGRFEHITLEGIKQIESPFDGDGLVERVQNTKEEFNVIRLRVEQLRDALDEYAKRQAHDNAAWHDDPDAPDHSLYHAPAEQQFPRDERDKAILELVARHLEVLNENAEAHRKAVAA